ncbi:hypothetical protein [Methylocaldum sp.]|uniref:hypothetical protein n=1 Tax=Methylocaldum sp. TaxID=1969727 RepID=UPI002D2347E7|nr:hypothetical protein [Methylocaldum sp.]HYE37825.1 hypothetical protein [Methylocaldum sp.]
MRALAVFIMRGRTQAVFAVCILTLMSWLIPFLSLLASASVGLSTLRKGAYEGGVVVAGSVVTVGVLGGFLVGSMTNAVGYGLLLWLPMWLTAVVLRESGRLSTALGFASVMGILMVAGAYLLYSDPSSIWIEGLERVVGPLVDRAPSDFKADQLWNSLSVVARYMTGVVSASLVISLILSLLIARWWQAALFNPGGFRPEFLGIRIHAAFPYFGMLVLIVAVAASKDLAEVAWNLSFPLFALFLLVGFSVLHALVFQNKGRKLWLVGIYVTLLFVPYVIVPIALVGLSDIWFDWRERLSPS